MKPLLRVLALATLVSSSAAQLPQRADDRHVPLRDWPPPGRGSWFTGDTHEHVQNCNGSVTTPAQIVTRMLSEGLNVANVLIWQTSALPYDQFVCLVTGTQDPASLPARVLQYSVETSGLDCSRWGHLIGMGIGPVQARIAAGSLAEGACADMPGLGLGCPGGDGTGTLNAPISLFFGTRPSAVVGYAHAGWTIGIYHPSGYDWNTELLASGFTTDARVLDPGQRLAFPDLENLLDHHAPRVPAAHADSLRTFLPLLGPMDAALGEAQFFETTFMGAVSPIPLSPPANWFGLYYKLLSAGLRVSVTAGSDRACPLPGVQFPQTSVLLDGPLTFDAWTRGIRDGRTVLGVPGLRVTLRVGGRDPGGEVHLDGPGATTGLSVEVDSAFSLSDSVEILVNGTVVASQVVSLPVGGLPVLHFPSVPIPASGWVAARLASHRAHSAAVYVVVDGLPIADGAAAEYWMMWCDAIAKETLAHPELELFDCQEAEALARIERARRVFQTHRDAAIGIDPAWGIARRGISSGACRGPIVLGASGPVVAGQPFRVTCVNAPPGAQGFAYVSRAPDLAGTCVAGARRWIDTTPGQLLAAVPVLATRSGYAEVVVNAPVAGASTLHAQFVWQTSAECENLRSCAAGVASESASDALDMVVH